MDGTLIRRMRAIRGVSPRLLLAAAAATAMLMLAAAVHGWPAWRAALPILVLWLPIVTMETAWMHRHYGWLASFFALVVWQGGHVVEHVAQMVQLHVLGSTGPAARGIFGRLDVEWVHFGFNTAIMVAVLALLVRFPRNPWLWVSVIVAGWHQVEHVAIMAHYLGSGVIGHPGLLADGGLLGGGIWLARPDLHFLYNVIETLPLVVGLAWQVRRTYDQWLARAFPTLSDEDLIRLTDRARPRSWEAGSAVVREGEIGDRFYVITDGTVVVTRAGPVGDVWVATLGPGQTFGVSALLHDAPRNATVRARERVQLLALNRDDLERLVQEGPALAVPVSTHLEPKPA